MFSKIFNHSIKKSIMLALLVAASIIITNSLAAQEEEGVNYGRIRYTENGLTIIRSGEDLTEEGTINSPIFPGDLAETGRDQRAEVQLSDSSFVRLDYSTKIQFQALSDMYNTYEQSTIMKLFDGDIYIEAKNMDDKNKNFQIDTLFASIYILTNGTFRINVDSEQRVEVFSFSGVAEIVGEYDSVLLRSGKMSFVTYKSNPADPRPFNSFYSDNFDSWNDERDDFYSNARRVDDYYDSVPYETQRYYSELSYYGGWVDIPVYGHVWYPYGTYAGWRPYYDGYWCSGPHDYFWVSYEPWGWAPYHYGRWAWVSSYGWVWVPGSVFGGAWVAWSYGPSYMGWCPLDYWNRPAFISMNLYLDYYDFRTWNFIYYRDVTVRNVRHAVLRQGIVEKDLREAVHARSAPKVRSKELSGNPEARKALMRDTLEEKDSRIATRNKERTPSSLPNFKEHEKNRIEESKQKAQNRALKTEEKAGTQPRGTRRDITKPEAAERGTPITREKAPIRQEQKSKREQPPVQMKEKESAQPPSQEKQDRMKSYPRREAQDRTYERTEVKGQDKYVPKVTEQDGVKARERETNSYPRKLTDDANQRSYKQDAYQQDLRKENQRTIDRSNSPRERQQQPRSYQKQEPQEDSNSRLQKMLRNMSQTPRTQEIEKREVQPRRETVREAPKKKQDEKPPSSGQSKSSSAHSQSEGKKSKGR